MRIRPRLNRLVLFPMAAGWLTANGPAMAQTSPDEVIIVTDFRPEAVDRRAGSATVVDAGLIDARGAEHLEDVLGVAANVTMSSGASRGRFVQIRGIGDLEQFVDPKHYPSVGVSLDGIDLGGIASAAMLFDVGQVTILRGPQPTRFGSTALAGQVELQSVAPGEVFDAYVEAGLADYGTSQFGVAAGGPLADNLAGRLAVHSHRSDGYMDNLALGRSDTNGLDETSVRARLHWTPRDSAAIDMTAVRFDSRNGYDAFSLDNNRQTRSDTPGLDELGLSALGLRGRWQLDSGDSLQAQLSWLDSAVDYGFDEDWSYVGFCDTTSCPFGEFANADRYMRDRDDISVDLRWLGDRLRDSGRDFEFVLGLFAAERSESLMREYYGEFSSDYAVDRTALYGQISLPLAARLALTAGLRYERFDDEYSDSYALAIASDDEFVSGEIALAFELTGRSRVYARLARGNKPGGVNTEASGVLDFVEPRFRDFLTPRLKFASERLDSLELGYSARLLAGRLRLRAAVFRMDRDAAQLESWFWDPVNFLWVGILDNADGANDGAELDLDFAITGNWNLRASLGVLDTRVDSITSFDLDLDDFVERTGIDQANAPSWQAYVGSEWRLADWRLAMDIEARDARRFGYYHDGEVGRATLVNASVSRALGATEITLWLRNLTDEDYAVHGLYFGNDPRTGYLPEEYRQLGEPRLAGLTLRHDF